MSKSVRHQRVVLGVHDGVSADFHWAHSFVRLAIIPGGDVDKGEPKLREVQIYLPHLLETVVQLGPVRLANEVKLFTV